MKIELFLDGHQVEINKDIDFVLNKQYTELSDLTSIIVDYSKTIRVPMTPSNNELFNYVYKLEHQVLMNEDIVTYDPSQKIDMTMTFNGSIVMDGYAVLNSVNLKEKVYEINLYGQLGSIFSTLKEKTLEEYSFLFNGWWMTITMNASAVMYSAAHPTHSLDWNSADWIDFWGFAPQMIGKSDLFNTKTYEDYATGEVKNFADDINTARSITYGSVYVKDGFDFNQFQEIRSYMTRPYVYVDKIIQLVQNEINTGDYNGYQMVLDPDWFNSNNPYYADLCFFPGNESVVDTGESTNGIVRWDNSETKMVWPTTYRPTRTSTDAELDGYTYVEGSDNLITINSSGEGVPALSLNCDGVVVRDRVTNVDSGYGNVKWAYYNLDSISQIPLRYIGIYDGSDNLMYKLYLCDDTVHSVYKHSAFLSNEWTHMSFGGVWAKLKKQNSKNIVPNSCSWVNGGSGSSYYEVTQTYNFGNLVLNSNSFKFKLGCDLINLNYGTLVQGNISHSDYSPLCPFKSNYKTVLWNNGATWDAYFRTISSMTVSSSTHRSGSLWTIKDILGKQFNPFKWLIDYVKKFRLFFDIDYMTKTITLKSGYFNNVTYKKVDVDYGRDVIVEPVVDKYYKVNYGYKHNESKKSTKYYKDNGVEYGDLDIYTLININNEKLSLTPDEEESVFIPYDLSCLSYDNLVSSGPIRYNNPIFTSKVINTLDKDGKIEYFPFFAFRLPNYYNAIQPGVHFWWISDDTPSQKNNGEYTYLSRSAGSAWGSDYLVGCPGIPQFDNYIQKTVDGDTNLYWCTFGVPKEVYNGYLPTNIDSNGIYDVRWKKYLNEIFNVHNKKVTCYIRMSYPEFINFKFNQLFVIDNCTFLVNKIIDFNPNSTEPTKVELIQVSEVDNLK